MAKKTTTYYNLLMFQKIENLGYYDETTEYPMSNLVTFDYKQILDPPPKNTSTITKNELLLLERFTKNRTKSDLDLIYNMDQDIDQYFIDLLNKNKLSYPYRYISLFYDVVEPILMNTKNYWNRPRPIQLSEIYGFDINVIVTDTIHTASYPSGHTVYSKLVANILSDMYPKFRTQFDQIAQMTALARVKQGVHYPSDNAASEDFANYVYKKLTSKLVKYLYK